MAKVITLGELMLRLSPPNYQRFGQASSLEIAYGGAEANTAVSLAQLGHEVSFLSKLPDNAMGDAALGSLRRMGVDCSHITRGGERLGIYYLEQGASVRPSSVIYDRAHSSFTTVRTEEFDFDSIFAGADLFHVTGITPLLSPQAETLTLTALKAAKSHGITVSFDLNYRSALWRNNIMQKQHMLSEMMEYVDICFGNARDASKCLGYTEPDTDFINGSYQLCTDQLHMQRVLKTYRFQYLVTTLRTNISASDNGWSAAVCNEAALYRGSEYPLHIIDRVGGGDAFAAGFLHGYLTHMTMEKSLEFAIAAAALKHTIPGDMNYLKEEEVFSLMQNKGNGRVQR